MLAQEVIRFQTFIGACPTVVVFDGQHFAGLRTVDGKQINVTGRMDDEQIREWVTAKVEDAIATAATVGAWPMAGATC